MSLLHQLQALLVTTIWGTNFVFIHIGLQELPPFTFATLRFAIVAFPLILFFPKPNIPWRYLIAFGVFIGFGQFGFLFWAMQGNITPGLASLVVQTQVFFTIFLAIWLFGESIKPIQIFALIISFIGLGIIAYYTDGKTTIVGLVMVLIAAFSWACGNLTVKKVGKVDLIAFLAWSSIFSVPPLFCMAVWLEGADVFVESLSGASYQTWLVVVWQSVGNTLIGYGLWNGLLHRYPAAAIAPWALLVPVSGMSASALFLGETLPWWKLLAAILIISGLIINLFANRPTSNANIAHKNT